jgi:hypothetical protein
MELRERTHKLRVLDEEGGVLEAWFQKVADQFIDQSGGGTRIAAFHLMLLALRVEENSGFFTIEVGRSRLAQMLLQSGNHWDSRPRRSEIDFDELLLLLFLLLVIVSVSQ